MIYNPQRIQDGLVQDTLTLTRLFAPGTSSETWLYSWQGGDSDVCLQDQVPYNNEFTADSSSMLTLLWALLLQYLSAPKFVNYLFSQSHCTGEKSPLHRSGAKTN